MPKISNDTKTNSFVYISCLYITHHYQNDRRFRWFCYLANFFVNNITLGAFYDKQTRRDVYSGLLIINNNNNNICIFLLGLERRNRLGKQQTTALTARCRRSATQAGTKARGM